MEQREILTKIGLLHNRASAEHEGVLTSVLKTVTEMLRDRGYEELTTVGDMAALIDAMFDNQPVIQARGVNRSARVYFHVEERVGVKQLRAWAEGDRSDATIVVSIEGPTAFTRREAESQHPHVQFFTYKELSVNITRHRLVPKHERIAPPKGYDTADFPLLFTTDRVAQYYDFKPGEVVRVTRTVGVQEPVSYYRMVVAPSAG